MKLTELRDDISSRWQQHEARLQALKEVSSPDTFIVHLCARAVLISASMLPVLAAGLGYVEQNHLTSAELGRQILSVGQNLERGAEIVVHSITH